MPSIGTTKISISLLNLSDTDPPLSCVNFSNSSFDTFVKYTLNNELCGFSSLTKSSLSSKYWINFMLDLIPLITLVAVTVLIPGNVQSTASAFVSSYSKHNSINLS